MVGVKYIASVSFGKDSLAMLLMLIEKKYPIDYVVFYNTGMEFDSIYHIRDIVKKQLKELNIERKMVIIMAIVGVAVLADGEQLENCKQ